MLSGMHPGRPDDRCVNVPAYCPASCGCSQEKLALLEQGECPTKLNQLCTFHWKRQEVGGARAPRDVHVRVCLCRGPERGAGYPELVNNVQTAPVSGLCCLLLLSKSTAVNWAASIPAGWGACPAPASHLAIHSSPLPGPQLSLVLDLDDLAWALDVAESELMRKAAGRPALLQPRPR